MNSVFYFYDLTDVIPQKVYLATYSHSRKIEDEDVNTYDREMLLVELIRKRNQISFDYYKVRKLKKN